MKNIKKISVALLLVTMLMVTSLSVMAADYNIDNTGNYVFKVVADKETVAVGEDVRLNFYVYDTVNGEIVADDSQVSNFVINYDADLLSVKSTPTAEGDCVIGTSIAGEVTYWVESIATTYSESTPFFYVDFTAKDVGIAEFTMPEDGQTLINDALFWNEPIEDFDSLFIGTSVEITSGEEEEEFAAGIEEGTTPSADEVVIFAKNTTGAELAANTYGIIFGGVKFVAGIDATNAAVACPKDGKFVVKFQGGNLSGKYKYQAYYGTTYSAEETVEIQ